MNQKYCWLIIVYLCVHLMVQRLSETRGFEMDGVVPWSRSHPLCRCNAPQRISMAAFWKTSFGPLIDQI